MGFFSSDLEEQGPGYTKDNLGRIDDLQSEFADVKGLGSLAGKFGLTPFDLKKYNQGVGDVYGSKKRSLGSSLSRRRSALTNRLAGQSANPEYAFSGLEGSFADAYGALEGEEAGALLGGQDKQTENQRYSAQLLAQLLGQKDQFAVGKQGMRSGALQQYLASLDDTSGFDDLLAVAGTASKFIKPIKL